MIAKKKAKELQVDLMDSAHKVWLAGLGAMSLAEKEGSKFFQGLVERGTELEKKGIEQVDKAKGAVTGVKTVAESYWETFERTLDDKITGVIHRLGVPTKDEIETLTTKVEDLTRAIEKMRATSAAKPAAKPRATAAKAKTATR
jgi:poly(hydroxyalkanoate) granule-associated protein